MLIKILSVLPAKSKFIRRQEQIERMCLKEKIQIVVLKN